MTDSPTIATLDEAAAIARRALDTAEAHPGAAVVLTPYVVRLLLQAAATGEAEGAPA